MSCKVLKLCGYKSNLYVILNQRKLQMSEWSDWPFSLFYRNEDIHGAELWKSHGTIQGQDITL